GTTANASRGGAASSAGNAAVSNYPGKVAARLRRAVRSISSLARMRARSDVQVAFVVDAGGGVGGIRVIRSSGSPELDQAALAVVRRAAPFPPIPPQAGRSSWAFTLPLGIAR
ncbi:MAG: TonB family protein, partial [Mesorhizobium sp.]